jgi:hypothetical protein
MVVPAIQLWFEGRLSRPVSRLVPLEADELELDDELLELEEELFDVDELLPPQLLKASRHKKAS